MKTELLPDGHIWFRIANADWTNPLDPSFAAQQGGRWNPPNSFATLYLSQNRQSARLNLRLFVQNWPYEPEDLRDDTGPVLVQAKLPKKQKVLDAHSAQGLKSLDLPNSYPLDARGLLIAHALCQAIGLAAKESKLRGVHAGSAQSTNIHPKDDSDLELAWFPARASSKAQLLKVEGFTEWFWA